MTQYINLLPPTRRRRRDALTLRNVALAALVATALPAGVALWLDPQVARLRVESSALRAQLTGADATRVGTLDTALGQELSELRRTIARAQDAATQLRALDTLATDRFSEYFAALSRQVAPGVWLTGFVADAPAQQFTLSGRALRPELIPGYLHRLTQEAVFRERKFRALEVLEKPYSDSDGDTRIVEFRLQSELREGASVRLASGGSGT
ncbi:MAG: PilN domain-containing protein [Burkholderiaceae bacterium]|nr:PilN domain-containing protein [Burkholderiaceae bacterium]